MLISVLAQHSEVHKLFERMDLLALGICISISTGLYIVPLALNVAKVVLLTQSNHKTFTRLDCSYTLAALILTVINLILFYSKAQDSAFNCGYNMRCRTSLHGLLSMLLVLRSFPLGVIGLFWLYYLMRYCCLIRQPRVQSTHERIAALKEFLESRVRAFEDLDCEA